MWIFLSILASLILLLAIILLLPFYLIIKSDEKDGLTVRFKLLFITFKQDSNNPKEEGALAQKLKQKLGIDKLNGSSIKSKVKEGELKETLSRTVKPLVGLIKKAVKLFGKCVITKAELDALVTGEDAAEAAINHGRYCAVIYPFIGLISSITKVKSRGKKINIHCDFTGKQKPSISYCFYLKIRVFRLLAAALVVGKQLTYTKKPTD